MGDGLEGGGGWVGGGKDLGFTVGATANTDLGAVFFVLEFGEAIFSHQIDDGLNLFYIHKTVILPSLLSENQKKFTISLKYAKNGHNLPSNLINYSQQNVA